MRAQRLWSEIVDWRWSPTLAISLGALFFVTGSILVIPDRLGETPAVPVGESSNLRTTRSSSSLFGSSSPASAAHIEAETSEPEPQRPAVRSIHGSSPQHMAPAAFPRRGFTPPLPRPEAEPPPPPPPPAAPPAVVIPPPAPPAANESEAAAPPSNGGAPAGAAAPDGANAAPPNAGAPTPPTDSAAPTPPTEDAAPTPPANGAAPPPPTPGSSATPPSEGAAPAAPGQAPSAPAP